MPKSRIRRAVADRRRLDRHQYHAGRRLWQDLLDMPDDEVDALAAEYLVTDAGRAWLEALPPLAADADVVVDDATGVVGRLERP